MPARTCPRCGAECDVGEPRCPSCGGYLGARRRTSLPEGRPDHEPDMPRGLAPLLWLLELAPGLARPKVLVLSLAALPIAAGLIWLALLLFSLGGFIIGILIGGFAAVVYWTAVAWVLHGEVCMPAEALAEFDSTKWIVFLLLAFAPVTAFLYYVQATGGLSGAGGS